MGFDVHFLLTNMYKIQNVIKDLNKKLSTHCLNYNNECIFLCEAVLGLNRTDIALNKEISKSDLRRLTRAVNRRIKGVPLQIIIGESDFLNVKIIESKNTLTPRPETEFLTDYIVKHESGQAKTLDLCCGSGCVGIALNKNGFENVVLADKSKKALKMAKQNAKRNFSNVDIVKSDMFCGLKEKFDLIVCNPPYIATGDISSLSTEVKKYDPRIALDGGSDGLDFYRIIARDCASVLNGNGILYLEIGLGQENDVKNLLAKHFKNITILKDLNQLNRFIRAEKC